MLACLDANARSADTSVHYARAGDLAKRLSKGLAEGFARGFADGLVEGFAKALRRLCKCMRYIRISIHSMNIYIYIYINK